MATGEATLPEVAVEGAAPAPAAADPMAGALGLPNQPGKVMMTNPDGSVGLIDQADASSALQQGMRPATRNEYLRQTDGTMGRVVAGAAGVGRGLTFGAFDPLMIEGARAIGGDAEAEGYRKTLNDLKGAHPTESIGGEIAGSLAGMYIMPGGAASKAISGDGLAARAAARFIQAAPRAAGEGALIAMGNQASEDALGNHDATAEKYLTSGLHGMVFGLILGGGLHALGGAASDKIARSFYGASEVAEREAGTVYRTGAKAADAAEPEAESGALAWLRKTATGNAEDQAFKATGAKLKDIQKLGATAEKQAERSGRIGRRLLDEGIVTATASQETIAQRLAVKTSEAADELSTLRSGLDKAVERPSTEAIANRVQAEVLAPLERLPGTQAEAGEVRRYMLDFMDKAGERPSFDTLHEFRRALDDKLNPRLWAKIPGSAPPAAMEMGKVRGILEDEFEAAGERAAKELGTTFGDKYRLAKAAYSDLKTAKDIVTKEVARGGANRTWSLTDTIAAGSGAVSGMVAAGPLGAAAGLGAAVVNKGVRTYGNQVAADVLNRASRLQILQRAAEATDTAITTGVKGFLSGTKGESQRAETPKVTAATIAAIREATRDPQALTARVTEALGGKGLAEAAPNIAQSAATTTMRIAAYLRDKAPKEPAPTGVTFIPQRARAGSTADAAKFARAVEVANDPMSVVEDLKNGRLNREKVEALEACYPQLYGQIRAELVSQGVQTRPDLSQQQQIALSVLFKEPVSAIMQPKTIRSLNDLFAQGADPSQTAQAGQPTPPTKPVRGLQRRGTMASGFDTQEAPRGK